MSQVPFVDGRGDPPPEYDRRASNKTSTAHLESICLRTVANVYEVVARASHRARRRSMEGSIGDSGRNDACHRQKKASASNSQR